jgi:hypothetical protein
MGDVLQLQSELGSGFAKIFVLPCPPATMSLGLRDIGLVMCKTSPFAREVIFAHIYVDEDSTGEMA